MKTPTKTKRYNHLYGIGFSLDTDEPDPLNVPWPVLRAALMDSIRERDRAEDWAEAFAPLETIENDG